MIPEIQKLSFQAVILWLFYKINGYLRNTFLSFKRVVQENKEKDIFERWTSWTSNLNRKIYTIDSFMAQEAHMVRNKNSKTENHLKFVRYWSSFYFSSK